LAIVLGIGVGLYLSREAWLHYFEQHRATELARRQMQDAEARRADLMRQKADLNSEAGREREAREKGWALPGEKQL
jgi:hypothetical protein